MFKFFKPLLLSIVLLLIFSFSYGKPEKTSMSSIVSYAKTLEVGEYNNFDVYKVPKINSLGSEFEIIYLISKENTAEHNKFDWRWTSHILKINYFPSYNITELEVIVRYYKDFITTKSRGFEQWILVDYGIDGVIDTIKRDYSILGCNDDKCKSNYLILPEYPEKFVNKDWYNPSEKDANKIYNNELNYWSKIIWSDNK